MRWGRGAWRGGAPTRGPGWRRGSRACGPRHGHPGHTCLGRSRLCSPEDRAPTLPTPGAPWAEAAGRAVKGWEFRTQNDLHNHLRLLAHGQDFLIVPIWNTNSPPPAQHPPPHPPDSSRGLLGAVTVTEPLPVAPLHGEGTGWTFWGYRPSLSPLRLLSLEATEDPVRPPPPSGCGVAPLRSPHCVTKEAEACSLPSLAPPRGGPGLGELSGPCPRLPPSLTPGGLGWGTAPPGASWGLLAKGLRPETGLHPHR